MKANVTSQNVSETIHYTFYCDRADGGTNVTSPNDEQLTLLSHSKLKDGPCTYTGPGTYMAKVIAEQGMSMAEDRATITVSEPAPGPGPTSLGTTQANYCAGSYLQPAFRWSYSSQYERHIQIDDSSGFGSPVLDSTTVTSGTQYVPTGGTLAPGTNYLWRVRARVDGGVWSEWTEGPGITTYAHRGPNPNFAWDPDPASTGTQIAFDNRTRAFDGSDPATLSYSWTFGPGANASASSLFEPIAIYSTTGNKQVRLEADDGSGNGVCSRQRTVPVNSGLPLPIFREIIPR